MNNSVKNFEGWNEKITRKYNPDTYYNGSSLIVRYISSHRRKIILNLLDVQDNDEVIEIGCGAGNILEKIDKGRLTDIDLSDFALEMARKKLESKNVYLLKGNAEDLPTEIKNKKFDKILCTETIEHTRHPGRVIDEILKIAYPKSVIVISAPNEKLIILLKQIAIKLRIFSFFLPNIPFPSKDSGCHIHKFSLNLLKKTLQGKLRIKKIKPAPFRFFPLYYVTKCEKII